MQSDLIDCPIKVNYLPTSPAEQKKNAAKEEISKKIILDFHSILGGNPDNIDKLYIIIII